MVLQVGGCQVTVMPFDLESARLSQTQRVPAKSGAPTPKEWLQAEAEIQRKTNMPFETTTPVRTERLSLAPRAGGKYHAITGVDVEIAKVVGRDGALWIVIDVNDRPVVLKRIDFNWHALPRDPTSPQPNDVIVHHGAESVVREILGEAEVGGWGVTSSEGIAVHVIRGDAHRWFSLGEIEVES
jgi:hypothetical protein